MDCSCKAALIEEILFSSAGGVAEMKLWVVRVRLEPNESRGRYLTLIR